MESKLTEVVISAGSSTWLNNKYFEVRGYPAEEVVAHELNADYTYVTGQPSSKAPSVRSVACPPQWLPLLLAAASPSPSPPPSPRPPPSPPSSPPPPRPYTFASTASLKTAVQAYNFDPAAAIATYGPIADWDVSAISDMSRLFSGLGEFNANISNWDTSGVTDMSNMFGGLNPGQGATTFNQPLDFDTSSVTDMHAMFAVLSQRVP